MRKLALNSIVILAGMAGFSTSAQAVTVFGLTATNGLVTFDTTTPGTLSSATPITGTVGGETIISIDIRPSNQAIYGYGSLNRLYTIAPNGVATLDSSFATVAATPTAGTTAGSGSDVPTAAPTAGTAANNISVDVNPNVPAGGTVGALRIVDTVGGNLRYAFANSTLNRDDTLTVGQGGPVPQVVDVAYTNNDIDGTTGTTLYYIDAATDALYTTALPNDGLLTRVGTTLGIGDVPITNVGFDIFGATDAYASINDQFYRINLAAGTASLVGTLGPAGLDVVDFAITIVPEPSKGMLMLGGTGSLLFMRRRKR